MKKTLLHFAFPRLAPTSTVALAWYTAIAQLTVSSADDWYRWRGPDGNGISKETIAPDTWGNADLTRVWQTNVGIGFSSVVVKDGRLFVSGNQSDRDTLYCLDALTGKPVWEQTYDSEIWPNLYEGGPNATATIDGTSVYTVGRHGPVFSFGAASGKHIWEIDLHKDHGFKKPSWGFTSAPLVQGDLLILNAGTFGLALNKSTGKIVWQTGKEDAAYATPEPIEIDGKRGLIVFGKDAVAAVDAKTGKLWWQTPWKTKFKVNAAQPIVPGNEMFVSSAYDFGCALFRIDAKGAKELWRNKAMENHFNSCILLDGHLYGISGTDAAKATLRCLDWKTGNVKWSHSGIGLGSLIAANDWLIVLSDKGELIFAKASPAEFKPVHRTQVLGGKCWTPPTLSNGFIYCRNAKGDLACYKLPIR